MIFGLSVSDKHASMNMMMDKTTSCSVSEVIPNWCVNIACMAGELYVSWRVRKCRDANAAGGDKARQRQMDR